MFVGPKCSQQTKQEDAHEEKNCSCIIDDQFCRSKSVFFCNSKRSKNKVMNKVTLMSKAIILYEKKS